MEVTELKAANSLIAKWLLKRGHNMNELPDLKHRKEMNRVIEVPREQQTMKPSSLNTDTSHAQGADGVAELVRVDIKKI